MSWLGRLVVEHIDRAEREVDFWLEHQDRLTREECYRIARGDYGSLIRPFEPEWPAEEWLDVATNLWIRPKPPAWRRGHYRIVFDVRDFRARLPRRVPQVFDPPELDDHGRPLKPTPTAIAEARLIGSYTAAAELAVPDVADEPDDKYLELFAAEAGAKRVLGDSLAAQQKLEEIHRLPMSRRIVELMKLADERGIDLRDDVKAFERRARRRLEAA